MYNVPTFLCYEEVSFISSELNWTNCFHVLTTDDGTENCYFLQIASNILHHLQCKQTSLICAINQHQIGNSLTPFICEVHHTFRLVQFKRFSALKYSSSDEVFFYLLVDSESSLAMDAGPTGEGCGCGEWGSQEVVPTWQGSCGNRRY